LGIPPKFFVVEKNEMFSELSEMAKTLIKKNIKKCEMARNLINKNFKKLAVCGEGNLGFLHAQAH
jgi:hypothetical protein